MFVTFDELRLNMGDLKMTEPRDGPRGIKLFSITYQGSPLRLRLADDLATIRIPFEPSTYNNNPAESRKNVVFPIPPNRSMPSLSWRSGVGRNWIARFYGPAA